MKQKITKISDEDFDGLLPSISNLQKSSLAPDVDEKEYALPDTTIVNKSKFASIKTKKAAQVSQNNTSDISIRLSFSTADFKSLTMIALDQGDKVGKRVSVTNLLLQQAKKLIKKGYTNA